jgi:hypothetical protein
MIPTILSEGPRDLRSENFGTKPANELVDLCTFSTTKCLRHS